MSGTQFVQIYHPLIPDTVADPALVAVQSLDEWYAKGWLLVDPDTPPPTPGTPYYTTSAADSRFGQLAGDNTWTGSNDFAVAPTVGGLPIGTGGGGGGAVASVNGQTGVVVLDADDIADGTTGKTMTAAERTKLAGVASSATANATDAQLRDRSTHTGTQVAASISDLTEVVQDIVGALIVAGTNTTVSYNDAAGTFTINSTGGTGGTTDAEIVRDTIGAALVAGAGIQITVNDVGDTITVASTAVLPTRQVIAGTGLTGGGDLSADRTLAVSYGTAAGTAAQGNDSRITGATPATAVEGIKVHDLTAGGGTRPTGYARVRWVGGTTRPTNMAVGDVWERDA